MKRNFPTLTLIVSVLALLMIVAPGFRPVMAAGLAQENGQTHVVRYGETLSEIAQSYGVDMDALMALNGITNPHAIYVGQSLRLPGALAPKTQEMASRSQSEPARTNGKPAFASLNRVYTVQAGDTLGWIALRYGVDINALIDLNHLDEGDGARIAAGRQLLLPATADDLRVSEPTRTYAVQPGDSLGLIAQSFDVSMELLQAVNRIRRPDEIYIGQELVIPGRTVAGEKAQVGPPRRGFLYHVVRPGETLSELAQQFNSTPQAIVKYNDLPDEMTVFSGLEIRIPYGPPPIPQRKPPVPLSGTRFLISISRQRCWILQGDKVQFEWKCSTGQGQWVTRTGTFPVKTKMEMAQSSAYRLDMPYWLGLYDVGDFENGIHGIPIVWETGQKLWDELVGQPATFGCAMLLDEDAARLFDLAYIGMPVHIVD